MKTLFLSIPIILIGIFNFGKSYSQSELMEIHGAITIGDAELMPAKEGTIRWNPSNNDFEGYDGISWKSLTSSNSASGGFGTPLVFETQKIITPEYDDAGLSVVESFGEDIDYFGGLLVVGSPNDSDNNAGKVYLFRELNGIWTLEQELTPSDGQGFDRFGISVAIDQNIIVVGAPDANVAKGKAYIFEFNGSSWVEKQILNVQSSNDGQFGYNVSVDQGTVLVASYLATVNGQSEQGQVYVYENSGLFWNPVDVLTGNSSNEFDQFGFSMDFEDGVIAVGAPFADINNRGTVYFYQYEISEWVQFNSIIGDDSNNIGFQIDISGDKLFAEISEINTKKRIYDIQSGIPELTTTSGTRIAISDQYALAYPNVYTKELSDWVLSDQLFNTCAVLDNNQTAFFGGSSYINDQYIFQRINVFHSNSIDEFSAILVYAK